MEHSDQSQQTIKDVVICDVGHNLINRLPNELLLEIFSLHVWSNYNSPKGLVKVCRLWEAVGSSPSLWANIFYGRSIDVRKLELDHDVYYRVEGMINCEISGLEHAIQQASPAKFELTIHIDGFQLQVFKHLTTILREAISNNCRLLRIVRPKHLPRRSTKVYHNLLSYLAAIPLCALEEFILLGSYADIDPSLIAKNLKTNSTQLRNISTSLFESCDDFLQLLPRITKLSVKGVDNIFYNRTAQSTTLQKLEELVIEEHARHDRHKGLENPLPMPALKRVTIETGSLYDLPVSFYEQLTHLTFKCVIYELDNFQGRVYLPNLIYLRVQGSWQVISHLDAPNLVTLVLHGQPLGKGITETQVVDPTSSILLSKLSPEFLILHKTLPHRDLNSFIAECGTKLKELSITYLKADETISEQLVSSLTGKKLPAICPLLQKLEIITPQFKKKELYDATNRRLQQVIDTRQGRGVLRRVRNGSYPLKCREIDDQRWWRIEWKELL